MSNKELAAIMEVSPSMASRVRNGRRLPSTQVLMRIQAHLDIPLEQLMAAHTKGPERFGRLITFYIGQP